jgi:transposase-like protein
VWTTLYLDITLDFLPRTTLRDFLQRRKTPVGVARRAHAMLLLEQGHSYVQTATWVGLVAYLVRKWVKRFQERGVAGLLEKPHPDCPPVFVPEIALHYSCILSCQTLAEAQIARDLVLWALCTCSSPSHERG